MGAEGFTRHFLLSTVMFAVCRTLKEATTSLKMSAAYPSPITSTPTRTGAGGDRGGQRGTEGDRGRPPPAPHTHLLDHRLQPPLGAHQGDGRDDLGVKHSESPVLNTRAQRSPRLVT